MSILNQESIVGVAALLVHAAKIDEQYSDHEIMLIKEFLKSYLKNNNVDEVLKKAEEMELNSNQLLNFTNLIKKMTQCHFFNLDLNKLVDNIFIKLLFSTNSFKW